MGADSTVPSSSRSRKSVALKPVRPVIDLPVRQGEGFEKYPVHPRTDAQNHKLKVYLKELLTLERLINSSDTAQIRVEAEVEAKGLTLPIYSMALGPTRPDVPVVLLVGGVHGIERIGTQVVLAFMQSLVERMRWDEQVQALLEKVRIVAVPLLNPGGMYMNLRANPSCVDLMRNAPIDAEGKVPFPLGGQRLSKHLAWYRGPEDAPMEAENLALEALVERELDSHPFSLALDCHSGFGMYDRIWFPYAYRRRPVRRIANFMALRLLWEGTYPNHDYVFEPQSNQYVTHGDVWDYLYKKLNRRGAGRFLPLTLEMGSWRWIKKRPRQLLTLEGIFNPIVPHRQERVLRRHITFLDFLISAAANWQGWLPRGTEEQRIRQMALSTWYRSLER